MNKYTLINIKANLNSCLSIGVNTAVRKLIEISIDKIDKMLEENINDNERVNNGICTIDDCNAPYDDDDSGWTVCYKHLKELANI